MEAPPPQPQGKIPRTVVLVDDDAVFSAYKAQMGSTLAKYDRVEMPTSPRWVLRAILRSAR
jgi:hypothetical protein